MRLINRPTIARMRHSCPYLFCTSTPTTNPKKTTQRVLTHETLSHACLRCRTESFKTMSRHRVNLERSIELVSLMLGEPRGGFAPYINMHHHAPPSSTSSPSSPAPPTMHHLHYHHITTMEHLHHLHHHHQTPARACITRLHCRCPSPLPCG